MSKRLTSGIVAAVVATSMSVPAVGFANKGGTPNSHAKSCTTHKHSGKHKGLSKKGKGGKKGKHCGIA
jgi:hypothetical protein